MAEPNHHALAHDWLLSSPREPDVSTHLFSDLGAPRLALCIPGLTYPHAHDSRFSGRLDGSCHVNLDKGGRGLCGGDLFWIALVHASRARKLETCSERFFGHRSFGRGAPTGLEEHFRGLPSAVECISRCPRHSGFDQILF